MEKNEVVTLMTKTIQNWNRGMARDQQMPPDTIEKWIVESEPQLQYVNNMLYDLLESNGIIK